MKQYPVYVPGDPYRGADPRRKKMRDEYNRVAGRVQEYLNNLVSGWPDDTYGAIMSYSVASAIGEDDSLVQKIIFGIDCGSGGVTVWKGDYGRALNSRR